MIDIPPSTQTYAMGLIQEKKADLDNRAANAVNNIVSSAMLQMFGAGYIRALVDHGIDIPQTTEETPV